MANSYAILSTWPTFNPIHLPERTVAIYRTLVFVNYFTVEVLPQCPIPLFPVRESRQRQMFRGFSIAAQHKQSPVYTNTTVLFNQIRYNFCAIELCDICFTCSSCYSHLYPDKGELVPRGSLWVVIAVGHMKQIPET